MGMSANFIIYICMYSFGLKMTLNQNDTLWIPNNTRGNNIRQKMHKSLLELVILCSHDLIYKQDCVINNSY